MVQVSTQLPDWSSDVQMNLRLESDEEKMRFVLMLLRKQIFESSGGPFAAAVFDEDNHLVEFGVNRVVPNSDSTAHAEMVAIRFSQSHYADFNLANHGKMTLVTSAQPCAMCCGAIPWAGVSRVVYGATAEDSQAIGFDEGPIHPEWQQEYAKRQIEVVGPLLREDARNIMLGYVERGGKVYNGSVAATPEN